MRKRPSKKHQLDTHINAIVRQRCAGVQIGILDIPKVFNEIYAEHSAAIAKQGYAALDQIVVVAYLRYAINVSDGQAKGIMDALPAAPVYAEHQS